MSLGAWLPVFLHWKKYISPPGGIRNHHSASLPVRLYIRPQPKLKKKKRRRIPPHLPGEETTLVSAISASGACGRRLSEIKRLRTWAPWSPLKPRAASSAHHSYIKGHYNRNRGTTFHSGGCWVIKDSAGFSSVVSPLHCRVARLLELSEKNE